ncbi:hypothetical protein SAMN06893096_102296 [Geodermatophilus pulveris]|uniref:DUF5666 domain-containing protein n=1 Tax=Geodermatophilus pulveris TaxID=1564159 RepID=A0A239CA49_9ACTN|nr:hypothetical protein [Geodermatophilus pulveris]SNS16223.1 hypothetical protein SAMN06893096_102296 [Geodermatophilus pulveris]
MGTQTTPTRRVAAGVFAAGLLLAGCGGTADEIDAAPEATATESSPADGTADPTATAGAEDTTATETGAAGTDGGTDAGVNCSGTSCEVTLTGDGAEADILGTPITLGTVADGRASIQVGDQELACSQGESVSAGPLTVECTTVTEDSVTMTASLG